MASPMTIPVQVEEDAAARIAELGLQSEFERILEHAKQTITDLRSIEVTRYDDPHEPGPPRVLITAWLNGDPTQEHATQEQWDRWVIDTMPSKVLHWFGLNACHWESYGR